MRLALLILLLTPLTAHADPGTLTLVAAWWASYGAYVQIALMIGTAVYGSAQQKKAARQARNDYNAGLQDRTVTRIAAEAPHVYVYGRAKVGSAIVAMFSSGDKDQYKHLVCVHAAHECDAIEKIYIAGKELGALDAEGFPTSGPFVKISTHWMQETLSGQVFEVSQIPAEPSVWLYIHTPDTEDGPGVALHLEHIVSIVGRTITLDADYGPVSVAYTYLAHDSAVRVKTHLGTPADPADAQLIAELPSKWTSSHFLRGFCYTVIRLDLNEAEFQGGPPSVEVLVRGKKLYDFRTGATAWSANPALAIYDYLTSELCGVDATDLPMAQFIAAANVCDESASVGNRYTLNGTVTADQPQTGVLEKMAQSMAGGIVSTTWDIWAGTYVAPVLSLYVDKPDGNGDVIGQIAVTPGISDADLYNGVRGQFISSETSYVATDFSPYQNGTYLAADGRDLWTNIDFPFTDGTQRVHNLARIYTEDQRNGYTVKAEFSLKAWSLKVGQRVTLTSVLFGWTGKVFRVMDKKFAPNAAVELTLKEDAAEIWDYADAVVVDATPNTNLPDPFAIETLASLDCESGTNALYRMGDGTVSSGIIVTWPATTGHAVSINGKIEIQYLRLGGGAIWHTQEASGSDTQVRLAPVQDGAQYVIRGRCWNPYLNTRSDWAYAAVHTVVGKSAPPPDVDGFSITNSVLSWPEIAGIPDLAGYKIRFHYGQNTSWANATDLHKGLITESPWDPKLIPPGEITLMLKAIDTSGNESVNAAVILNNFGDPIVDNLVLVYDDKAAGFAGTKTNCSVVAGNLVADDSGGLFWGADDALFWGADTDPFWPTASYKEASYLLSYTVQPDEAGSRMTLLTAIAAESYLLEYRYDTQGLFWGNEADYFWPADTEPFWPAPTEWQTWPGAIEDIQIGVMEFRITMQAGTTQGVISALTLQFDVEDEREILNDVAISAAGTRLPITKSYRSIKIVNWSLQDDGSTAVRINVADKSASGPLTYGRNNAEANVAALGDFEIIGIKG